MKHQTIAVLDDLPVMLLTIDTGFDMVNEWAEGEAEMRQILESREEPLFFVADIREMRLSFDDLIVAASLGSRGQDPIWHHPKMRSLYFISESTLVKMAAAGLNNAVFGNTSARVFGTVEQALENIQLEVAAA